MVDRRAHAQERRRDRRIPVVARVRIQPEGAPGLVLAQLVDVSAGGLRATYPAPCLLETGTDVQVEISVQDAADATHPPLVNLRGRGRILRIEPTAGQEACHAAVRFTGALKLREPFAQMLLF